MQGRVVNAGPCGQCRAVWSMQAEPSEQFQLDTDAFLVCLWKSGRGAVAVPSAMTSDHLFPLLDTRSAMLEGLLRMEGGDQILLFARYFNGPINIFMGRRVGLHPDHPARGRRGARRSSHAHAICIGSAPIPAAQARLQHDEQVVAHFDDIYAVCRPNRVCAVFAILQQELQNHAHIQLHLGKTQGLEPGRRELTRLAILGVPIGQLELVQHLLGEEEPGTSDSLPKDSVVELLDRRTGLGSDGTTPTTSDVVAEHGLHVKKICEFLTSFRRQCVTERSFSSFACQKKKKHQGEGGEQGDALMPLLFAVGQHQALEAAHRQLQNNESIFAFLDDT